MMIVWLRTFWSPGTSSLPAYWLPVAVALNSCSPDFTSEGTSRYRSWLVGTALRSTLVPSLVTSEYLTSLVTLTVAWLDSKRTGPTFSPALKVPDWPLISRVGLSLLSFWPTFLSPVRKS